MDVLKLLDIISRLKTLKRTGWVLYDIPGSESVADHTMGVSLLALALSQDLLIDQSKLVKMALLHDLGEAVIGDIPTARGAVVLANAATKRAKESKAVSDSLVACGLEGLQPLITELEAGESYEARIVRQLDKLEMAHQALVYERQTKKQLDEFFENALMAITEPAIRELLDKVIALRPPDTRQTAHD